MGQTAYVGGPRNGDAPAATPCREATDGSHKSHRALMGGRIHPALVLALVGAVALGAVALRLGAFSSGLHDADRRAELTQARRSLLPPSWREIASQEGQCVALADYPSCLNVAFDRRGAPRAAAESDVRAAARAAGWEATGDEIGRSATLLHFRRGKLSAFVELRESPRSTCGRQTVVNCNYVDNLQVTFS